MDSSSSLSCFSRSLFAISPARGLFIFISLLQKCDLFCSSDSQYNHPALSGRARERGREEERREKWKEGVKRTRKKAKRGENGLNIHLLSLCSTRLITSMFLPSYILSHPHPNSKAARYKIKSLLNLKNNEGHANGFPECIYLIIISNYFK